MALYAVMNLLAAVLPGLFALTLDAISGPSSAAWRFLGVGMLYAADALPREHRARALAQGAADG